MESWMDSWIDWLVTEHFDRVFFSIITVIVVTAAILDFRDKNRPPGPAGIPYFGFLPYLNHESPYKQLMSLTHQYGRVFGVQLGSIYAVIVADVKLIKETFLRNEFQPPSLYLTNEGSQEKEICSEDGKIWKEHQNFVSSLFRNIGQKNGLSKASIENQIQESVREFLQDMKGDEQNITPCLRNSVGKMIMGMVLGTRCDQKEADFEILKTFSENYSKVATITGSVNYVPFLRRFSSYTEGINKLVESAKTSSKIYNGIVQKHSESLNENDSPQSILDAYLVEIKKRGNVGNFTKDQIEKCLSELVNGGWESSLTTLTWLYLYMAMYPEVQEKIAKEIAEVMEGKVEVKAEVLDKLVYTEATMLEIWRLQTTYPLGVPHATKDKTKLGDYVIPENSMIIPLLWAVHHDSRLWEKPELFSPERFLYEDGCIFRNENLLPFQTGNRMCMGEEFKLWTVKFFFASTVNQFQFQFPKGYTYNGMETPTFGRTLVPKSFPLVLQKRMK